MRRAGGSTGAGARSAAVQWAAHGSLLSSKSGGVATSTESRAPRREMGCLKAWETSRNVIAEPEQSVREIEARKGKPRAVKVSEVMEARLSRRQLAACVSAHTHEGWEQRLRKPTGQARLSLTSAMRRPDVLGSAG